MKNFKNNGETINYVVPSGQTIVPGQAVFIGTLKGVAKGGGTEGQTIVVALWGRYEFDKISTSGTALTQGGLAYWNAATKKVTGVSSGNTLLGVSMDAYPDGATTAEILISN